MLEEGLLYLRTNFIGEIQICEELNKEWRILHNSELSTCRYCSGITSDRVRWAICIACVEKQNMAAVP
jgi:hypothetical protein